MKSLEWYQNALDEIRGWGPTLKEKLKGESGMVMSQMVTDEQVLAATTADVLAGTQLDQPGVPGVYSIWISSTVGDTVVDIIMGGRTLVSGGVAILRANSEIREDEDNVYQMVSRTGNRPVITITEVTAMACRVRTKFIPAFPS